MTTEPTDPSALLDDDSNDDFDDDMSDDLEEGVAEEDEFGDAFEEPEILVGILRMHVSECRKNPKNLEKIILELTSEVKATRGQTMTSWFDFAKGFKQQHFKLIAKALGCEIKQRGKKWVVAGGLVQLKNKGGLFVIHTWGGGGDKAPNSDIAQGVPDSEKSKEWKDWRTQNPLSKEQIAVLQKCCGVIPKQHEHLFDASVAGDDDL